MAVKPIPDGYHAVTPYLILDGADKVIEFLKQVFDASAATCFRRPDGKIGHAEVRIGDSPIMIAEATENHKSTPCMLYFYVTDTDAVYKRAIAAGATSIMEPANQFYGDRTAGVRDASGMQWWMGTHVEDVPEDEIRRRHAEAMKTKAH